MNSARGSLGNKLTGKRAVQEWCRLNTEGYANVSVRNMTTSWRDGLALCALIHHFRPDLIDFKALHKGDIVKNNTLAFQIAEDELGIPSLLDVSDLVEIEEPEELSMTTYASMFYKHFKNQIPRDTTKIQATAPGLQKRYLFDILCDERVQHRQNSSARPASKHIPPPPRTLAGNSTASREFRHWRKGLQRLHCSPSDDL